MLVTIEALFGLDSLVLKEQNLNLSHSAHAHYESMDRISDPFRETRSSNGSFRSEAGLQTCVWPSSGRCCPPETNAPLGSPSPPWDLGSKRLRLVRSGLDSSFWSSERRITTIPRGSGHKTIVAPGPKQSHLSLVGYLDPLGFPSCQPGAILDVRRPLLQALAPQCKHLLSQFRNHIPPCHCAPAMHVAAVAVGKKSAYWSM